MLKGIWDNFIDLWIFLIKDLAATDSQLKIIS